MILWHSGAANDSKCILAEARMHRGIVAVCLALGFAAPALAAVTDPTHIAGLTPDKIEWRKGEASDQAWPIGDPSKAGACLELIRWHPGHFSHPHFHSHERYAVVLDGTWWVSTSNVYDPDHNTVPYAKGSVLTDLAGGVHYDGAKA